jgi:hypothetical protein
MIRIFILGLLFSACTSRNPQVEKAVSAPQKPTLVPKDSMSSLGASQKKPLRDKSIRFLGEERHYDPKNRFAIGDSVLVFRLDDAFLKEMSEPEKAVLAYVATFADSDNCDFSAECDGKNGIQCKIVTALGLGCQCSSQHFEFLHQWFEPKAKVFQEGHCYQRPMTASRRILFSQINLTVKGNMLTVWYQGSGNTGTERWQFNGTEVFQLKGQQLVESDSKHEIFNTKKYED